MPHSQLPPNVDAVERQEYSDGFDAGRFIAGHIQNQRFVDAMHSLKMEITRWNAAAYDDDDKRRIAAFYEGFKAGRNSP